MWHATESFGDFHKLPLDVGATYHSALGTNGIVKWSTIDGISGENPGGISCELNFAFEQVDWAFQQTVYGWAALQYHAYARGFITVVGKSPCRVILYADNVLQLALNDKVFFGGDFYGFRRAPMILNLAPGENKIDLRLVRDVRAMGGIGRPDMSVRLCALRSAAVLTANKRSIVLPDVIDRKLCSPYASIILRNESEEWINVVAVQTLPVSLPVIFVSVPSY